MIHRLNTIMITLITHASVPSTFWDEALQHATYIISHPKDFYTSKHSHLLLTCAILFIVTLKHLNPLIHTNSHTRSTHSTFEEMGASFTPNMGKWIETHLNLLLLPCMKAKRSNLTQLSENKKVNKRNTELQSCTCFTSNFTSNVYASKL